MKRAGTADLPLHNGRVPYWLAKRMRHLGGAISEVIVEEYGRSGLLSRISDPNWFQALGCVLGMDWHSSGITTSVMGALKGALNEKHAHLGIRICGGRGRHSRNTPNELVAYADSNGLNGDELARTSRLGAKIDNTAVQDGFQIYLHNFIITEDGEWVIIQQGMNGNNGMARRYHWHSTGVSDFCEEPHAAICGQNQGKIINLTHKGARAIKSDMLKMIGEDHPYIHKEIRKLVMPRAHEVKSTDVNLQKLGAVLSVAHEQTPAGFEELLLTPGLGPRTLQSLVLVSEMIYGSPSRFTDPARFSFAHGGKDGHPFPVPLKIYDQTIDQLDTIVRQSRLDISDKKEALKRLHTRAEKIEKRIIPDPLKFEEHIAHERKMSPVYDGHTAAGPVRRNSQLRLF